MHIAVAVAQLDIGRRPVRVRGGFSVSLTGTFVATIIPERSTDQGATWKPFTYSDGSAVVWTAPMNTTLDEPRDDAQWRLRCSAWTRGTAVGEIGQ